MTHARTPDFSTETIDLTWLGFDGASVTRSASGDLAFHGTDLEEVTEATVATCMSIARQMPGYLLRDVDPADVATTLWLRLTGPKRKIELLRGTGHLAVAIKWLLKDFRRSAINGRVQSLSRFDDQEESLPIERYLATPSGVEVFQQWREAEEEHAHHVEAIQGALAEVSADQRNAFLARAKETLRPADDVAPGALGFDLDDLDEFVGTAALAEATGRKPGTVASHASRATQAMRRKYSRLSRTSDTARVRRREWARNRPLGSATGACWMCTPRSFTSDARDTMQRLLQTAAGLRVDPLNQRRESHTGPAGRSTTNRGDHDS